MGQLIINVGLSANDNTGDTLRVGGQKINTNFTELYAADVTLTSSITALNTRILAITATDVAQQTTLQSITATDVAQQLVLISLTAADVGRQNQVNALTASDVAQWSLLASITATDVAQQTSIQSITAVDATQTSQITSLQTAVSTLTAGDLTAQVTALSGQVNNELYIYGPTRHRQCLLEYTRSAGVAAFITTSSLSATLLAPLAGTVMASVNSRAERNVMIVVTSSITPTGWIVGSNATTYLYIEIVPSTGVITYGKSTGVYTDSYTAPSSPTTGDHWLDRLGYRIATWNGSAWVQVYRLFVAQVVSGASSISSTTYLTDNEEYVAARTIAFTAALIF